MIREDKESKFRNLQGTEGKLDKRLISGCHPVYPIALYSSGLDQIENLKHLIITLVLRHLKIP